MATAVLTSKGQITIPITVRQRLGVTAGDRLEFIELADGGFVLVPAVLDVASLKGLVRKPRTPVSVEDMRRVVIKRAAGK
jgi:AbrB family looped-hinge helix DNA binding protein